MGKLTALATASVPCEEAFEDDDAVHWRNRRAPPYAHAAAELVQ